MRTQLRIRTEERKAEITERLPYASHVASAASAAAGWPGCVLDDLDAIGHGFFRFLGARRFTSGSATALRRIVRCIILRLAQLLREFMVALVLQQSDGVAKSWIIFNLNLTSSAGSFFFARPNLGRIRIMTAPVRRARRGLVLIQRVRRSNVVRPDPHWSFRLMPL
jgi:hypothetical protein